VSNRVTDMKNKVVAVLLLVVGALVALPFPALSQDRRTVSALQPAGSNDSSLQSPTRPSTPNPRKASQDIEIVMVAEAQEKNY